MTSVTIRARTPDDDAQIVEIENRIYPEFPPETVEEFRHWDKTRPATALLDRWVAEENGTLVAHARLAERWATERKNLYFVQVVVDPARRHQGIGTQLYDVLVRRAAEVNAERLYVEIREDDREAEEFGTRRGFSFTGHAEQMSRLNVSAANLDGYDGVEERLQREGIRIVTLAEVGMDDDSFLRALHAVDVESSRDIPGSEVFMGFPYEVWIKHLSAPGRSPESCWIAMDGDSPVGSAELERRGMNAAFNGYTGVARSHRGRGVARALKLKTIEWSRRNGIDFIYTGNHVDNKRMLAINISLGYKPLPRFLEFMKERVSPNSS
mgnify:CR=1 FL=1